MIDKKDLKKHIDNKDYSKCSRILFEEIRYSLINELKQKNPNYTYITITDLKNQALKYLSTDLQSYAIILYTTMIDPSENELYDFKLLLSIYEELKNKNLVNV